MELYISNKTWKEPKLTKGINIKIVLNSYYKKYQYYSFPIYSYYKRYQYYSFPIYSYYRQVETTCSNVIFEIRSMIKPLKILPRLTCECATTLVYIYTYTICM